MAQERTFDQIRAQRHASMGQALGELHFHLQHELYSLHIQWNEFRVLYAKSAERVQFLNKATPAFFGRLQYTLWYVVLLHIGRLTDNARVAGHNTLTVKALPPHIPDLTLRGRIEKLLADLSPRFECARDWRNRRLAHRELPPLDGSVPESMLPASRHRVEAALSALRDILNTVQLHYEASTTDYERSTDAHGNAEQLLLVLKRGLSNSRPLRELR